ncbi:MAG: HD domain-containing protein [Candidatus Edwardsbacteria bacterium]|nr:HD domain-containing protein [Candidatus Edwardsbacteria bacterium]
MKPIANFLYEVGLLKRVKRSGWWLAGIKDPETVAEHSYRAAIIAHLVATLEHADAERACAIALFHDTHEARVLDLHKVAARYLDTEPAEAAAVREQVLPLPDPVRPAVQSLKEAFASRASAESRIARDADYLECLAQALEYKAQGNPDVDDWIVNCRKRLVTKSAQRLAAQLIRTSPDEWWEKLKQQIVAED